MVSARPRKDNSRSPSAGHLNRHGVPPCSVPRGAADFRRASPEEESDMRIVFNNPVLYVVEYPQVDATALEAFLRRW